MKYHDNYHNQLSHLSLGLILYLLDSKIPEIHCSKYDWTRDGSLIKPGENLY